MALSPNPVPGAGTIDSPFSIDDSDDDEPARAPVSRLRSRAESSAMSTPSAAKRTRTPATPTVPPSALRKFVDQSKAAQARASSVLNKSTSAQTAAPPAPAASSKSAPTSRPISTASSSNSAPAADAAGPSRGVTARGARTRGAATCAANSRSAAPHPSANYSRRYPFLPPEPKSPLTMDDLTSEAYRRLHPGGIRCPLVISNEECGSLLATRQILEMHLNKHAERLKAKTKKTAWIGLDGFKELEFKDGQELEKYIPKGVETFEQTVCIFAGCEVTFRDGTGRSAHNKAAHPLPYSYDQLRPLNAPLRPSSAPPPPPPLPEAHVSDWQLVTPLVPPAPTGKLPLPSKGDRNRKVYSIVPVRDDDDPFIPPDSARLEHSSSNFLRLPTVVLASGEEETEEAPVSQIPRSQPMSRSRSMATKHVPGPIASSLRIGTSDPSPPTPGARMELTVRQVNVPLTVNLRHTAEDVISANVRAMAAEAMRKNGEVPPDPIEGGYAMSALETEKEKARLEKEKLDKEKRERDDRERQTAGQGTNNGAAAAATSKAPAPVYQRMKRRHVLMETAKERAAGHVHREEKRKFNLSSRAYAFAKTGEWVGFDFYEQQQMAYQHGVKLAEAAAEAAKANADAGDSAPAAKHASA